MMKRAGAVLGAALMAAAALAACDGGGGGGTTGAPTATPETTAATTATVAATTTTASAAPSADPAPTATVATTATATAAPTGTTVTPAASGSAAAGPKKFDCGEKGQKNCPMQGWMKSVMGSAASSGDGEKLAKALSYVAGKAPPGMGQWSAISSAGAAKAKAGDIDGAKASCKQCHDLYKNKYVTTMRDMPW